MGGGGKGRNAMKARPRCFMDEYVGARGTTAVYRKLEAFRNHSGIIFQDVHWSPAGTLKILTGPSVLPSRSVFIERRVPHSKFLTAVVACNSQKQSILAWWPREMF